MKHWRVNLLVFLALVFWAGVSFRLFQIQIINHGSYAALAENQSTLLEKLTPQRGEIFIQDKNGFLSPLAINKDIDGIYLVPRELAGVDNEYKNNIAENLASILSLNAEDILKKLEKNDDPYEPLKSKIDDEAAQKIKDFNFKGVHFNTQSWRWYPQNNLASQVIGFVGYAGDKRAGLYGLEKFYEAGLAGEAGILQGKKNAFGAPVLIDMDNFLPAKNGDKIILTIDQNIQFTVEERLKATLEKWQSPSGTIIVIEPKTGAIRAMASLPDFNPNEYSKEKDVNVFLNPVIQNLYEPGSIFKPVTMSAGLDSNKITPETTFTDTGLVQIGGYNITNAVGRSYGLSSMSKVLEKSINTGVVFVEKTTGHELFKKYVQAFGFDRPTGITLSNEIAGNINNLNGDAEINYATAAFGQGIAVTSLQIASAISAIANQGKMMKPYLVDKVINGDGKETKTEPQVAREPITAETAKKVTEMLVNTVDYGYDKIKMKEYFVAGKTGTAQIPEGGGYSADTIHSFVGYAPAYDPAFLVFIKMDRPKGINFASDSLSPVFADIARFLLNYYEIPPER